MKCAECNFHYKDTGDAYARCHFVPFTPWDSAPCEYEDYEAEDYDEPPAYEPEYISVEKQNPVTGEIYFVLEEI